MVTARLAEKEREGLAPRRRLSSISRRGSLSRTRSRGSVSGVGGSPLTASGSQQSLLDLPPSPGLPSSAGSDSGSTDQDGQSTPQPGAGSADAAPGPTLAVPGAFALPPPAGRSEAELRRLQAMEERDREIQALRDRLDEQEAELRDAMAALRRMSAAPQHGGRLAGESPPRSESLTLATCMMCGVMFLPGEDTPCSASPFGAPHCVEAKPLNRGGKAPARGSGSSSSSERSPARSSESYYECQDLTEHLIRSHLAKRGGMTANELVDAVLVDLDIVQPGPAMVEAKARIRTVLADLEAAGELLMRIEELKLLFFLVSK